MVAIPAVLSRRGRPAGADALGLAWLLGASPDVLASLAPKAVTSPIALGINEQLGGVIPLMMGGLLVTGVMTTALVGLLSRAMKIRDPRILGFVLGLNGHVIGTVRAFEIGPTAGAFASLGMSLTGIFSAPILPSSHWPGDCWASRQQMG